MARKTVVIAANIIGTLEYRQSGNAHVAARTATEANLIYTPGALVPVCSQKYFGGATDLYLVTQTDITATLVSIPAGALIKSASLTFVGNTVPAADWASPAGTRSMRLVDPGAASATLNAAHYKEMDGSPANLFDLVSYNNKNVTVAATAAGIQHLKDYLISDGRVNFVGVPESMIENNSYYDPPTSLTGWSAIFDGTASLSVSYEIGDAAMMGINF